MNLNQLKGWLTLQNPKAEKIALDLGFLQGSQAYTRFIILGRSRTGSNFLRGFLKNHPEVISLGEIFREIDHIEFDSPYFSENQTILSAYQNDPVNFLRKNIFRKFRPNIKAVGFKLFYYHASSAPYNQIWDYLIQQNDIHVIHIKRRNILQTHISRLKAVQNNQWVNTNGKKEKQISVIVNPDEAKNDFETTRQSEMNADQQFSLHPLLQIAYEDLVDDPDTAMQNIQGFLGLTDQPAQPQTYKQSHLSLAESITNYDSLKAYFAKTEWSVFFEE